MPTAKLQIKRLCTADYDLYKWQTRLIVKEGAKHRHIRNWQQQKSGFDPQMELNAKTERPTDRRSKCDFDFVFITIPAAV
jgi:hypothetical protein